MNDELQSGDAGAINDLADAFHQAGTHLKDADDQFNAAKQQFKDSYNQNNGVHHPINDGAEVQTASAALAGHPEELSKIAVDLEQLAAALSKAQRDSAEMIDALDEHLHAVDEEIATQGAESPILMLQFFHEAEEVTKVALDHIENIRGAYADQLHGAETAMLASGYVPDALDPDDGIANNAPTEAADKYESSGQRTKDQATVDKANKEHPNGFGWSLDQEEAKQRLADYTTVKEPAHGSARFGSEHEKDEATRLAGERLDDWNVANSVGAVPKDPVLGGDMRDRAKARLTLQRQLQDAQLGWSPHPMNADDATRLMDQKEVEDRASALTRLQQQLQDCGMSPEGAAKVAQGFTEGVIPKEYAEAASAASAALGGGTDGIKDFAELLPTGDHWGPGVAFSEEDIAALKKLGSRIGGVGSAIDLGMAAYEIFGEHQSPVDVLTKAGAGMAGAWMFGEAGAWAGGAVAGPPGAFFGALGLGTVGAFVGEDRAQAFLDWVRG
ncbi:hypothetical protein BH09ACT8_BH09ACT8_42930 [soil metagenome]